MAIDKDLNVSPYYDDYDEEKKFHRVLFKPAVPVQARELTQVQSILQNQIERMGQFNFKEGSVVKGCPFTYDNKLKYAKLMDKRVDGQVLNTGQFVKGQYAINQSNVILQISDKSSGYEATTPDLNTIYGKYVSSANGTTNAEFAVDETISIYNETTAVDGTNSSVAVTISTDIDTTPNATYANAYSNADTFTTNSLFGSGLAGTLITNGNGTPTAVNVTANGSGYKITELISNGIPIVVTTSTGDGKLSLSVNTLAKEYQVKVANSTFANALGDSYQFTVGDGVIYQKGHFVEVDEQSIIVDKYTNRPDQRSVAFDTIESTVNSTADSSLLDNAAGYNNENAPGADRLKLSANLVVNTTSNIESTNNALKLVSWENGFPVRVNQQAKFAALGNHLAQRTAETQGDYVVNPFTITSESFDANTIALSISSGVAYVGGNRFELTNSSRKLVDKATTTLTANSQAIPFNYGRSVDINNYLGDFGSDKSPTVYLLDTAYGGLTGNTTLWRSGEIPVANGAGVLSANVGAAAQDGDGLGGTDLGAAFNSAVIGTVKLNNVKQTSGTPGFANAEYKAYLGGFTMRAGKKFADARAIWTGSNTSGEAIADIVLTAGKAKIKDNKNRTLIFDSGAKAVKTITDSTYPFRAAHQGDSNSSGHIAISNTFTDTTFIYGTSGTLSTTQKKDLIVIPGNTVFAANITAAGAVAGNMTDNPVAANTTITASGLTANLVVGDTVRLAGNASALATGNTTFRKIDRIINSTAMSVTPGVNTAIVGANNKIVVNKAFLKNVPINLDSSHVVATLSNSGKTLTIDIGAEGELSAVANLSVYATEKDSSPTRKSKKLQANVFVHINCANAAGSTTGPWDLGLTDIRSIKNVYHGYDGAGGITNTAMPKAGTTDYSANFELDNGQKDGFYGLGKLILSPDSTMTINSVSRMTVEVDCFLEDTSAAGAAGFFTKDSYPIDDADSPAANTISTQQIPIFKSPISGKIVDLRNSIDIRPVQNNVSNTAATVNSTANAGVTVNPNNATTSGWKNTGALRFGQIDENFVCDNEYYLRRIDKLEITSGGHLIINKGEPALRPQAPITKNDNMQLGVVQIPPYPSLDNATAITADRPDLAIRMNNKQVQRLTQKQINNLQQRVGKLEYYTSLNLLEKAASDLVIGSSANSSLDRFKNGILVDDFQTMTIGDLKDREFKAGHDKGRQYLQARFNPFPIKVQVSKLRSCRQTGDTVTIDYKQRPIFKQGKGTTRRRVAGRDWQYRGSVRLYPDYDAHVDKNKNKKPGIGHPIDIGPITIPPGDAGGCFPPHYTDPTILEDGVNGGSFSINFDPINWIGTEHLHHMWDFDLSGGFGAGTRIYGMGVGGALSPSHEKRVGDYMTDIMLIGKIRDQIIYFHATGLRPNMKHYIYFDGTDVTNKVRGGTIADNSSINSTKDAEAAIRFTTAQGQSFFTSDAAGEIAGAFYLPADTFDTGSRKFVVLSESTYTNFTDATSRASGIFNSFNFEVPHIEHPSPPNPKPIIIAPDISVYLPGDDREMSIEDITDHIDPAGGSVGPDEEFGGAIPWEMRDVLTGQIGTPELPVNPSLPLPGSIGGASGIGGLPLMMRKHIQFDRH